MEESASEQVRQEQHEHSLRQAQEEAQLARQNVRAQSAELETLRARLQICEEELSKKKLQV